ncbi:polysaccharide pyruvyl transferase family protein, partial [Faecalicatena contorta]|uniref:polysaccharide pyruvyl transferase family protein n=1 Tax=Faecalicatena contorta TaxID=39482 RepID=UPI001F2C6F2F
INWESNSIRELCENRYDAFIAGSDQIWNPFFEYNSEREFLTFSKREKRIAYAASMGIESLPDSCKDKYREWLSEMAFISVRESSAANIIYELTGKLVPVVLDPVFLLNKYEWNKLATKANCSEKSGYVFFYFLGKHNEIANEWTKKIANARNLRVLNILEHFNEYGPLEFVALIKDAEMVVTNSFHCTAFSIIFHKQFVVFERQMENVTEQMTSRLNTLLSTFDLEDRFFSKNWNEVIFELDDIKWKEVDCILKERREESIKFITEALEN